jgi:hypothetical protein
MIFCDCNRFIETSMRQGEERKSEWTRLNASAACSDRGHCLAKTAAVRYGDITSHRVSLIDSKATFAEGKSVCSSTCGLTAGKRYAQAHYQRRDALNWTGGHCGLRSSNRFLTCLVSATGDGKGG